MSIVITGNPGVGKHTITQQIANRMKLSIIDINEIAKDSGLFEKNGDTNDIDVGRLEKILEQKVSENNVVVGHLAPYVLKKSQVSIMIVLRRSPYDLIPVYKDRKYSDKKTRDNTGSEILGIIANDAIGKFQEKTFQINVSGKTVAEMLEKIMSVIMNKKGNEEVDWLELVTKNNDLGKFFVD
ncbi:MAG: adenylate kinase family protein [Candidatus Nitrosopumilus sp. bin_32a]